MEELDLTKELYNNIMVWANPKYSINSLKIYSSILIKIFKNNKVLSTTTLKGIMKNFKHQNQRACIVLINRYCYDNEIPFNIIVPSIKKQAQKLPEIYSIEEIKLIVESAPYPYNLVIRCIFNMGAGLRVSEIIKMSWNHIRWVDWLGHKENYGVVLIKSGKGSKDRVINIPAKLMMDLYNYAKLRNVLNEYGIPNGGMIFSFGSLDKNNNIIKSIKPIGNDYNDRWKNQYVRTRYNWFRYNIIQKHCEKALNKHIKIHSLRHSRATYLYEYEDVPVEKIQLLLGHASLNTTMIYIKANPRSVFELIKNTKEI